VAQKVTAGVYKGVTTTELDELAAETAAGMTSLHPDYAVVRARAQSAKRLHVLAPRKQRRAHGGRPARARAPRRECAAVARRVGALRARLWRVSGAARGARARVSRSRALRRRFFKALRCRRRRRGALLTPRAARARACAQLAARISVASLHKTTSDSFAQTCVPPASRPFSRRRRVVPAPPSRRRVVSAGHARCVLTRAPRPPSRARSIRTLHDYVNERSGLPAPLIAPDVYKARASRAPRFRR
jgi:hypothetical protein